MDSKGIKIKVSGSTGVGKSAVIQLIMNALRENDIHGVVFGVDHKARSDEHLKQAIDSIKRDGTQVVITECYGVPDGDTSTWIF